MPKMFTEFQNISWSEKSPEHMQGGSNVLECHFCHKVFAFQQSKSLHLKTCKIKKAKEQTKEGSESVCNNTNNITNNTNNANNQQIIFI